MLLAFKLKLALACAAGLAGPIAVVPLVSDIAARRPPTWNEPAIVQIASGTLSYRAAGDFTHAGKQAEAPIVTVRVAKPVSIMKHQVSSADYQVCVQDGACRPLERSVAIAPDLPVVQVSWHDADAYASWLSRKTGRTYRLPSDEEWAFAAGSKFTDDGVPVDVNDPSRRSLGRYERESDRNISDPTVYPFGKFGSNEHGVSDLAGNVWEWTSTCFVRGQLDETGHITRQHANCGVRVAEGAHRAYVTDFIRDARAGGCAQGLPPANLGFRLVREETPWLVSLSHRLSKAWPARS
ncbi:SUMF1/EgtB/PvdO family nonheme iron enzyme [Bradyrhizobium japonicum]|uniref:SUMF1/EgtB/PvdO family nonheme iron enzyme n=1 Tax=Bradyrhizobium japonicum TaxID=375 RepID=UPI001BAA5BB4|nr:SUMF1/EgtB/PvdO family nonheme iron enzyme [Bradyrhizobium japonicum]MBR0958192.1 SUMF1/EgtB/PvdO family nonheme iron enzyme [Bradyrhizobium japonicum]